MDVSVVITCWNGRHLLEKNLPSVLKASKNPQNHIIEVMVVDDASTDDSVEFLKNHYPEVRVISQKQNFGYSITCNIGVENAKGDLVVIFNLDVVPLWDFLEAALPHFKDDKVFSVSFNEGKFGPGKLIWKNGFLEIEKTDIPSKTALTDWPSGGTSIFKKEIWQSLGGMDELFLPFYFEDIDLGIRARKAGFQCLWEPEAKVKHEHEATINSQNFRQSFIENIKQRNHLVLTWKNIDSFSRFSLHSLYILKRFFLHPGYFKVVITAVFRKISFALGRKLK